MWKFKTLYIIIFLLLQGLSLVVPVLRVCCWWMLSGFTIWKQLFLLNVWKASLLVRNSGPTNWSFFFPILSHSSIFLLLFLFCSSFFLHIRHTDPLSYDLYFFIKKSAVLPVQTQKFLFMSHFKQLIKCSYQIEKCVDSYNFICLVDLPSLWQTSGINNLWNEGFIWAHGLKGFDPQSPDSIALGLRRDRPSWQQEHGG